MKKKLPLMKVGVLLLLFLCSSMVFAQIQSTQSGNWNTPSTWVGGVVPADNQAVTIDNGHIVSVNTSITRNAATTVNGTFQINAGGWSGGSTFFNYGVNGTLVFNLGTGVYDVNPDATFWPATITNVKVNTMVLDTDGIRLNNIDRTVAGTLLTSAGVNLNTSTLTLNGNTQIENRGYFANTPVYGDASTLTYNTTGGYTAGNEWTGGGVNNFTAGAGIPNNVTVQLGTQLSINGARGLAGNFLVQNTASVTLLGATAGQDLFLKGNFSILNTAIFNPNNRAVVFRAPTPFQVQDIFSPGSLTLHYIRLSGGSSVRLNQPLTITAPNEGNVIQFSGNTDKIYLNNRSLTLGTAGLNNTIGGGSGTFVGTTNGTSDLTLRGNGDIGYLRFSAPAELRNLTLDRQPGQIGVAMATDLTVQNNISLKGLLNTYTKTLKLGLTTSISQSNPANQNFIIADGDNANGKLQKIVLNNTNFSFTFPVGNHPNSNLDNDPLGIARYSPITVDVKKADAGINAYVEVQVFDKQLLESDTNYLTRYWSVGQRYISNPKYSVSAFYHDADVGSTFDESTFFNSVLDTNTGEWSQQGKTNAANNQISFNNMANLVALKPHYITAGEKVKKREISIRGNGIEIAPGDVTPDQYDNTYFGTTSPNFTVDHIFRIESIGTNPLNVGSVVLTNNPGGDFQIITGFSGNIPAGEYRDIVIRFNGLAPVGDKIATLTISSNDAIKSVYNFAIKGTVNTFITCAGFQIIAVQNFESSPALPTYQYSITENIPDTSSIIAGGLAYGTNASLKDKFLGGNSFQVFNAHSDLKFNPVNLSTSIDPYLVFNLAAFGYANSTGLLSGDDVVVSVSTNGTDWYPQIRIVSGNRSKWAFDSLAPDYIKNYSTNLSDLSTINLGANYITNSTRYIIKNLPKANQLYVRFSVKSLETEGIWAIDDVMLLDNTSAKTWNGAAWTGVDALPPTFSQKAIINGDLTITPATSFSTCECEVKAGKTLTIGADSYVNVQGNINVATDGNIIVESDGNLVQINDEADNRNDNGTQSSIAVRREHTLTPLRKEYNFLSSPVAGQNMKMIYGNNAANVPFVMVLNEATNYFVNATAAHYLLPAKGFAVKEPRLAGYVDSSSEGLANNVAQYKGVINNGVIEIDLARTSSSKGYNVVGNPYPSNMDIKKLYANSVTNFTTPEISSDFRFWDNKVNTTYVQMGGAYQGYSYAVYNAISDASAAAPGLDPNGVPGIGTKAPSKIVKISQAFMVRALQNNASMKFNNSMREVSQGTSYYGRNETPDNRYRLQLRTAENFVVQNAVTYIPIGNNGFGFEDTRIPNSSASDALFSYAGDAKVVINGRSNFNLDDVVILGLRHFTAGTYKIQAVDQEGVFANGQSIYLKDKELGTIADLTAGDYTFTSNSGEYTNRFEIVYQPEAVLVTDGSTKSSVEVYRDALDFVVHSSTKAIDSVELYDASGRLLLTLKGNKRKELRFNAETLVDGMYVLKAVLKDGTIKIKKIRK